MLEFWFDPKTSVAKKIVLLILIAAAAVGLYIMQPMALQDILLFAGTGVIYLICRYCKLHFFANNLRSIFYRLLTWLPIALLLALIFKNMNNGEILIPGALGIIIIALLFTIFTTVFVAYALEYKR